MPLVHAQDQAAIRILTLDRPGEHNAVGPDMTAALDDALQAAETDPGVRVVVLTGAGRVFSAGGNVQRLLDGLDTRDAAEERRLLDPPVALIARLLDFAKPTLAMINGSAAGGGLALALACDLRFAAAPARLAYAYGTIGLAGDFGINWLLGRLLGAAKARRFAFSDALSATEAEQLGLVDQVCAPAELEERTLAEARRLAVLPPAALAAIKRNLAAAALPFATAAAQEADSFVALRADPDHRAALAALTAKLARRSG